jgi:hypothetical protein
MSTPDDPRPRSSALAAIGVVTAIAVVAVGGVMGAARLLPGRSSAAAAEVVAVEPGETVEGVLRGQPDRYVVEASVGDALTVDLRRRDDTLDPFLRVIGPSGMVLGEDDDGGSELNARLRITIEEDGEHEIVAAGTHTQRGAYALDVVLIAVQDMGPREIIVDEEVESRAGAPAGISFDATAGTELQITAQRVGDGDPYLRLFGPDGQLVGEDDDSGGNLDSALAFTVTETGTYRLEVDNLQGNLTTMRVMVEATAPLV